MFDLTIEHLFPYSDGSTNTCSVQGHHNLLFCGDFARRFRLFAQLYKMELLDTGYEGEWPV